MLSKSRRYIPALVVAALLAAAACSSPESSEGGGGGGGAADEPFDVVVLAADDPPNLDPHTAGGQESANILTNVYDPLTALSADLTEVVPSLATDWRAIDDTTWEFDLREGVSFHNGEEFNADAVKFSVDRILDPDAEVARIDYTFPTLESAEVIDEFTVRINTTVPDPIFPERAYSLRVVPPEYTSSIPESEFALNPIGTGPFVFEEFRPGQHVILEAFDDYWEGRPEIDRMIFRPVPEASTRAAELQTGGADIIQHAPVGQIAELEARDGVTVHAIPGRRISYLGMNLLDGGPEELKDVRVRHALNYAVDVDLILETVGEGYGAPLATLFRPDFFGYDESIEPFGYDPDRARELLAEAGYPDGFPLTIQVSEAVFPSSSEAVNAIAAQFRDVGIDARIEMLDHGSFRSVVIDGQEANNVEGVFAWNWGALEPSADSFLGGTLETGGISAWYSNPELDELIQAARQEMDLDERARLYSEVQQLVKDEAPFVFLYQIPDVYGVSDRIEFKPRLDQYILGKYLRPAE